MSRTLIGKDNVVFFDGKEPDLAPSTHERAVIVITGHSDKSLEAFIDHLASKGYLKTIWSYSNRAETSFHPG
jgi:hypothetical protein